MNTDVMIGAVLAGIIGMITAIATIYFTKYVEKKSTKKYASTALLLEVEANLKRFQLFAEISRAYKELIKDADEEVRKILEVEKASDEVIGSYKLPKEIRFERTIYSALADKIGFLDDKSQKKVVQFYEGLTLMEDFLRCIPEDSKDLNEKQRLSLIKGYFMAAENAYKTGEETIKNFEEQVM